MKQLINLYYAGLELTLACPCRCETCGSNAHHKRRDELDTDTWVQTITELSLLGCQRVTLLGGEPLLFSDWPKLSLTSKKMGLEVEMVTSGIGLDRHTAATMAKIGLASVTVSVDGTRDVHNEQRKVPDAFGQAMQAIACLREAGVKVGVTTQINPKSLPTLEDLAPELQEAGVLGWQLQLTMPSGRAAGRADLVIQKEQMREIYQSLQTLSKRPGLRPFITDNIGYLTPDDPALRTPARMPVRCWLGCFAGLRGVGVMSDGGVKGCLALPDSMREGNLKEESLTQIWQDKTRFAYNRAFDPSHLGGECNGCPYGKICRGGCTAVAMTMHGRPNISTHCLRLI